MTTEVPRLHVERAVVTLRLRPRLDGAGLPRFHFHHGGALRGLLSRALESHALGAPSAPDDSAPAAGAVGVVPVAVESGRVHYRDGAAYRFGVVAVAPAPDFWRRLHRGLTRVGSEGVADAREPLTLAGNFAVESLDAAVPPPDVDAEVARLRAGTGPLTLRLLSPLQIPRPASAGTSGHQLFDAEYFALRPLLERVVARLGFLDRRRQLGEAERAALMPTDGSEARLDPGFRTFVRMPFGVGARRGNEPVPQGVVGWVGVDGLDDAWLPWLVVAQHVHVGERVPYGFGRFRVERAGAEVSPDWCAPAQSLLDQALSYDRLVEACEHNAVLAPHSAMATDAAASGAAVGDNPPLDGASASNGPLDAELPADEPVDRADVERVAAAIRAGSYVPTPLHGMLLPKGDAGVRPLAVPAMAERVVQRAAARVLAESAEVLFEDCSYAYRRGRSYRDAVSAVTRATRNGFRWVLDADITAFFDSVDLGKLDDLLHALYPDEPLVPLLSAWLRAPVDFAGVRVARERGLPQGMPISPVLANLFLDRLDEALLSDGFGIVRYADDFVVVCRDAEQARAAQQVALDTLAALGLQLHPEKTRIVSLDEGFTFLGHAFIRSMVVETPREEPAALTPLVLLNRGAVPPQSWLAQVPLDRLEALDAPSLARRLGVRPTGRAAASRQPAPDRVAPPRAAPPRAAPPPTGTVPAGAGAAEAVPALEAVEPVPPLAPVAPVAAEIDAAAPAAVVYLTREHLAARLDGDRLHVERPGEPPLAIPARAIWHVIVTTGARVTVPLVLRLADLGVPVYFVHGDGSLRAEVSGTRDWAVWEAQRQLATRTDAVLAVARAIVSAKLHNAGTLAVRFGWPDAPAVAARLRAFATRAEGGLALDEALGFEGAGAALYFGALSAALDPSWGFVGRRRRPAPDPVNAMLSFGYALLHRHVTTACVAAGLNPRVGVMHRTEGEHAALASDLQEEWRWLADAQVWSMIARREIAPADFQLPRIVGEGCYLSDVARRKFVAAFERRLLTPIDGPRDRPGDRSTTYRELIAWQARRLRDLCQGRADAYAPYRLHA